MPNLLEAFDLSGLTLRNRMVMAPMTRTRASDDGRPLPLMINYYAQRASAGLIVTECTQVSDQGHGIIRAPGLHRQDQVNGWRPIVDAVHAANGRIYCQLWHCGRVSHPDILDGALPVAPSAVAASGSFYLPSGPAEFPIPRVLGTDEISGIIDDFRQAAVNAEAAGFDGVELHGAFGYLPDQFLQDGTNQRTDSYGGSITNRARFMLEVVEALAGVWSAERVGVKLSPSNRFYGMFDSDARATFGHVIGALDAMRVGYLHLMEPNAADLATGTVQIERVAEAFRGAISVPLIANGGFDMQKAQAALDAGTADLISFGVPFLANPDLPIRFKRQAPLNEPDRSTFYGEGSKGYTDYPAINANAEMVP
jgi:N-ethylmaleimide reductase